MIRKFDRRDRRVLTFPAVHPCEGISPATLLASLIDLSGYICSFQSTFFATQRRNAREAIRQIGILLMFFEEIRDRELVLSDSVVLCFSELHLAFQKIQFLLEDCTREGARVWILMKSQFVATQFRVLIRTIATALDVLPVNSIDVSAEAKDLFELVAKQARRSKFELDSDDETAMKQVLSILNQFESGVLTEQSAMELVLDHLNIQSWGECNKEVRFLEEEISSECSGCEERGVPLLSSLMGFMSYCRATMFETFDYRNLHQTDGGCSADTLGCLNPEDFRCPISLELMIDPVTVSTGQTYDRPSIQKWLKSGNLICPKTGEKLTNSQLVPNSALRNVIHQFCAENGIFLGKSKKKNRDITKTTVAGSLAAAEAMKFLAEFLTTRLTFGVLEQKNKAAYEIRLLAKSSIFNRACLVEAGAAPPLLNLLASSDPSTQENAISALLKLSKHAHGKKAIVEKGGLRRILAVLKRGLKLESRQIAAATLFYLASVGEYRKLIGETPGAIPALVRLIEDGKPCGKKNAVVAIFGLLLLPENHRRVLVAGAVPPLIGLLNSSERSDLMTDSLAVLASLAETFDGSIAIHENSGLPLITKNLCSTTSRVEKEYSVSILLSMCTNGGMEVTGSLSTDPSVLASLYSLVTDGTSQGSKKARSLIRILHKFQERRSSNFMASTVPQDQFVHVW
ncbi:U-box domain-containing protein 19-like [Malania oleifera]|uniref:U-box domain-containing protein 19-like n=1 Tax=Malania oleifera TaxID=397392 RepID=UPI0025AE1FEA|nr:U-box domain-containing protein 19-like [Malania oleifera]